MKPLFNAVYRRVDALRHYEGYRQSGVGGKPYTWAGFERLVRAGRILLLDYTPPEADGVNLIGLECLWDDDGPYLSVLFYWGDFRPEYLDDIVPYFRLAGRLWLSQCGSDGLVRLRVLGRRGWLRVFRAAGIEINNGWVTTRQERVRQWGFRPVNQVGVQKAQAMVTTKALRTA